ncbi:hypothetical protein DJ568_00575 [Mucilaginibacter hurinus]|uniref:Uncharacterized protein n=1 Tax=Mucilaginibacter hurinus TaxID=2201324 RepID=A0A367GSH3_9SPHI|nr:hypothetical protein [Mucilaginibacter hurinus]RCH56389.1 hypothetical protein DJ568_00575 [Mucilaginibacter hurinus]
MSSAFVKEGEYRRLEDVAPTLNALMVHLTAENNGIRVYEKRNYYDAVQARDVYEMTDGLNYAKTDDGKWYIVWD